MDAAARFANRPIYINVLDLRPELRSRLMRRSIYTYERLSEEMGEVGGIFDGNDLLNEDEKIEVLNAIGAYQDRYEIFSQAFDDFKSKYKYYAWLWDRRSLTRFLPTPHPGSISAQVHLQRFLSACVYFVEHPEETPCPALYAQCLDEGEKVMELFQGITGFLTLEPEFDEIASYCPVNFDDELLFRKRKPPFDHLAEIHALSLDRCPLRARITAEVDQYVRDWLRECISVFDLLRSHPGLTLKELMHHTGKSYSYCYSRVKPLETRGFIECIKHKWYIKANAAQ